MMSPLLHDAMFYSSDEEYVAGIRRFMADGRVRGDSVLVAVPERKLALLRSRNLAFRPYRRTLIMENKWRAARWGTKSSLIDFGKEQEVPLAELMEEMLEFVDEVLDELGSRKIVEGARRVFERGTGAERQLAVYHQTGDLKAVMDYVVQETESGLDLS